MKYSNINNIPTRIGKIFNIIISFKYNNFIFIFKNIIVFL